MENLLLAPIQGTTTIEVGSLISWNCYSSNYAGLKKPFSDSKSKFKVIMKAFKNADWPSYEPVFTELR